MTGKGCPKTKSGKHRKHTPIKSKKQKKLFGIARGIQKGETSAGYSPVAAKIAKTVSPKVVRGHIKEVAGRKLPLRAKKRKKLYKRRA